MLKRSTVETIQSDMAWMTNFIKALRKLKAAEDRQNGVALTYDEVKAVLGGFRLLRERHDAKE